MYNKRINQSKKRLNEVENEIKSITNLYKFYKTQYEYGLESIGVTLDDVNKFLVSAKRTIVVSVALRVLQFLLVGLAGAALFMGYPKFLLLPIINLFPMLVACNKAEDKKEKKEKIEVVMKKISNIEEKQFNILEKYENKLFNLKLEKESISKLLSELEQAQLLFDKTSKKYDFEFKLVKDNDELQR